MTLLQKEIDFIHADVQHCIDQSKELRHRADIDTALQAVNRSDADRVLRNKNLSSPERTALCIFLSHVRDWPWLKFQNLKYDLVPRASIALLSGWMYGRQMAKCGLKRHHCQQPDFCFLCAWRLRQSQAFAEYAGLHARCVAKGYSLYAMTASFETNPKVAGLHLVTKKGDRQRNQRAKFHHLRPYRGQPVVAPVAIDDDADNLDAVKACFEAGFKLNASLLRRHLIVGAVGHRGLAFAFQPHWALPHVHSLIVTPEPITPASAEQFFRSYARTYDRQPSGRLLYPDLHISPLPNQSEVQFWLKYIFLPLDYLKPYRRAVRRGANLNALNAEIDDRLFQGGDLVLREVTSPRRCGCLRVNVSSYLGTGDTITRRRAAAEHERRVKRALQKPPAIRSEAERRLVAAALAEAEG